ncbi:UNVERIFIED_CONTAM: hypothetical protein FKN15_074885 [Acipenser sinensis]
MNTRCPPKSVPSAACFFTLCSLTVQPPQSYSVGGQRSSGQLTGKPAGARLNCGDYDSTTPLHMAAICGNTNMVKFLQARGAEPTGNEDEIPGEDLSHCLEFATSCFYTDRVSAVDMEVRWYRDRFDTPVHLYLNKKDQPRRQDIPYRGRTALPPSALQTGDISLHLRNLQPADTGVYTCLADDGSWNEEGQTKVIVTGGWHVVGSDQPVIAEPGDDVILPCHISPRLSAVDMEVRWYRDRFDTPVHLYLNKKDQPRRQDIPYRGRTALPPSALQTGDISLHLRNLQPADTGVYTCLADDGSWNEEGQTKVIVTDAWRVVGSDQPVIAEPGDDVILPCHISPRLSAVDMEVRWYRDRFDTPVHLYLNKKDQPRRQDIPYRGRTALPPSALQTGDISLHLRNLQPADTGVYTCLADDGRWNEEGQTKVIVTGSSAQEPIPPTRLPLRRVNRSDVFAFKATPSPLAKIFVGPAGSLPRVVVVGDADSLPLVVEGEATPATLPVVVEAEAAPATPLWWWKERKLLLLSLWWWKERKLLLLSLWWLIGEAAPAALPLAVEEGVASSLPLAAKVGAADSLPLVLEERQLLLLSLWWLIGEAASAALPLVVEGEEAPAALPLVVDRRGSSCCSPSGSGGGSGKQPSPGSEALGTQPSISMDSTQGEQTQLVCRSEGWYPEPEVIWRDRDGNDVTSLSSPTVQRDSQGLLSVSSHIKIKQQSNVFSCLMDLFSGFKFYFWLSGAASLRNFIYFFLGGGRSTVDVTLDPDTAQPWLTLSAEGKQVRVGETRQCLPDTPERFNRWLCVLGREGFTSGRRYWQVQTPLPLSLKPQKLGVYLDYEEGQLSFYNVETRSHIYTFTDMEFNPNEKLYPFFCTGDNTDLVLESPDPDPVSDGD